MICQIIQLMEKFIFLDIDGVLNTANYQSWRQFWGKDIYDDDGHLFAPFAVRNLARLIKHTEAKIVLSSSWRLDGLDLMRRIWENRKMPGEIYDNTPYVNARYYPKFTRGIEIKTWLEKNDYLGCPYVIIDDIDDFLPDHQNNVVLTNYKRGLTLFVFLRAMRILIK